MFRRGASLPARPIVLNKNQILEDLNNASPDDVIYEYSEESISSVGDKHKTNNGVYEFDEELTSASYLKVDSFLDKINSLKNNLSSLKEQKSNLKNVEENLLQDMSRIRKELNTNANS